MIDVLEKAWIQYFGYPAKVRPTEGAFRGRALENYMAERGIELLHVPAEHHEALEMWRGLSASSAEKWRNLGGQPRPTTTWPELVASGPLEEKNLSLRLKAEKMYLELQAKAKLSRAANSRTKPALNFVPGNLVYYQRYKVPAGQSSDLSSLDAEHDYQFAASGNL